MTCLRVHFRIACDSCHLLLDQKMPVIPIVDLKQQHLFNQTMVQVKDPMRLVKDADKLREIDKLIAEFADDSDSDSDSDFADDSATDHSESDELD